MFRYSTPAPNFVPKYKSAVVSMVAVYPVVTAIEWVLGPYFAPLPLPLHTLVVTSIVAPALTYGALPLATYLLRGWLGASAP